MHHLAIHLDLYLESFPQQLVARLYRGLFMFVVKLLVICYMRFIPKFQTEFLCYHVLSELNK